MKNSINLLYQTIALILIVFAFNSSFGQAPTVTINYSMTGLHAGDTVRVPVVFNSTASIANWEVILYYNRDVLKYDSCSFDPVWGATSGYQPAVFGNGAYTVSPLAFEYPNKIATKISWSTPFGTTGYTCNPDRKSVV